MKQYSPSRNYRAVGIILLFIGVAIAPSIAAPLRSNTLASNDTTSSPQLYTRHRYILINGNDDLIPKNGVVGGTGTQDDPYVISGWGFDGSAQFFLDKLRWTSLSLLVLISLLFGDHEAAISLSNTDKYVIIRDNYFIDWTEPTPPPDPYGNSPRPNHLAIAIGRAEHIIIENNRITRCNEGILCASPTIIRNNSFTSITGGLSAVHISAQGTVVEQNEFHDCDLHSGIHFLDAQGTVIIRNNSFENIDAYTILGVNGLVENNILVKCDIAVKVGNSTVRNNRVSSSIIGVASFDHNTISHNELINNSVGLGCYWPPHACMILDNSIQGNTYAGIYAIEGSQPVVHDNNIFDNNCGLYYRGGPVVNATFNWWGSATGPSGAGQGTGDPVSEDVNYTPWLTSPNPDAGRQDGSR